MNEITEGKFPEVRSRQEMYLQDIIKSLSNESISDNNYPDPLSRQEAYLQIIISKLRANDPNIEINTEDIEKAVNKYLEQNPIQPGATENQAQQIEENKKDVASLKAETGSLKEDLADLTSSKISKFYASNQGENHLADSDSGKIADMMVYGKSEQKQYSGKNLFDKESKHSNIDIGNYWDNTKRSIVRQNVLNWLDKEGASVRRFYAYPIKANSKYTLSFHGNITNNIYIGLANASGIGTKDIETFTNVLNKNIGITTSENETYLVLNTDGTADVMLELGTEASSYEPYTGGQPSPSPDYPQEIKSVVNPTVKVSNEDGTESQTVTIPYTLNALPVSAGGNVTIDGQQYIADYVDVERGKLIRNIDSVIFNGAENESWMLWNREDDTRWSFMYLFGVKAFSLAFYYYARSNAFTHDSNEKTDNRFWLCNPSNNPSIQIRYRTVGKDVSAFKTWLSKNPVVLQYALATPTETDLTPEEIQVFKALATYYPVTNISVNSGH